MARGGSDSGGGFAAFFLLFLGIAFVVKYIWWFVGAAALVGLFFAVRAIVRHAEDRRLEAADREARLKIRADRQLRWTLAGDSRAVYGPDGASGTHGVSPPAIPETEPSGDRRIATLPTTAGERAALAREEPDGWQWALFTSVLIERQDAVRSRLRDSELGFTPSSTTRVYSTSELGSILLRLIDEMLSTLRQTQSFMAAPAFMIAFCDPANDDRGDAEEW